MTVHYIGDTVIPIITDVETDDSSEQEEIDLVGEDNSNFLVSGAKSAKGIEINFVLNKMVHPDDKSLEEQRSDVKQLARRHYEQNRFEYGDFDGYLVVETVSFPEQGGSALREGTISGKYLPLQLV